MSPAHKYEGQTSFHLLEGDYRCILISHRHPSPRDERVYKNNHHIYFS